MLLRHGPQIMTLRIIRISFTKFDFIHQERKTGKKGGGILIYVKNHIKFKIIKDLSVSDGVTVDIEKI